MCDNDEDCHDDSDEYEDLCKYRGKCGGHYNTSSGFLTSPSYPDTYQANTDCTFTISQPTNYLINVTVHMFLLADKDYLEIRDGSSEESPLIGRFNWMENDKSITIQSSRNQLWIK